MFKLSRRLSIIRASLVGCLVVAVLSTAGYFIVNQRNNSDALTKTGDLVNITADSEIGIMYYGPNNHSGRWYKVKNTDDNNKKYDGFCAQASNDDPREKGKEAKELSNSSRGGRGGSIKLMIFLWQYDGSDTQIKSLKNTIFGLTNDGNWGGNSDTIKHYVFTHAVASGLYDRDYGGLPANSDERNAVLQAESYLEDAINQNHPAWQEADTYKLFYAKDEDSDDQDVVWIEPTGSIIVYKRDSATGTAPQGDGSFTNITFTLSDGTTSTSKTLAAGATSVTFSGLDPDKKYTVSENGGTGYSVLPAQGNISPTAAGTQVTFTNTIKKGKLIVHKKDKDTGSCPNITNGLSLVGIQFKLYNKSSNSVYYENSNKPVGGLVATRELTNENPCSVSFEGLPYGRYELEEVIPDSIKGWVKDTTRKPITIYPNSDSDPAVEYTFENQPIRSNLRFVKNDPANHITMANAVFEISSISNDYVENHIVISDENGVVDTGANPHSFNTNGYDAPYHANEGNFIPYSGYGTWFGIDKNHQPIPVRDDVGALPYGTYLIQELKCDAFLFCDHTNNQKKMFSITEHGVTVSFEDTNGDGEGDWNNDCAEFSLATTATDNSDGDHYVEAGQDTAIKDVVNYCAKAGFTFTIKGILMDKSTNQPLLINGEPVEQSVEVSPTDNDCGTVEMLFPINSSDLAGKSVVVFEKLYYKNELKATHEDINDEGQTVDIVSLGTVAVDNSDDDKLIVPGEETVIKDTVSYCAPAGQPYTITGVLMDKTTGNAILINEEPVTQSVTFTPEQNCGTVELIFPAIDTTAIAGHPIVAYETLYKVVPGEPGEPDTKEPILPHEDPNDPDQTVYVINISTTVQPTEDGTKVFPLDSDVTVTDMVHYCLQPGLEYTIKGIVMDKSTGNGLLVDSKLVEQSVTFTPTEVCGEFPMYYTFNTKGLTGAQLVIFESLYYNDELLIEHKDIENELESFEIDITPPDTGFITKNASGSQETSHQELLIIAIIAIAPVGIYAFNRRQARKHFLNR
ncbi:VaFE repeat-containing surface-anchored protein [Candidatus Saccharibacteria bacterium]|nr:VaFE repeat-containing surface-anchored protein [Candidatus Saccharibacteria bacterium]